MAPIVLLPAEEVAAYKTATAELIYLLDKEDISYATQCKLYHVGVRTLGKFASLVADAKELKVVCKDDFGIDGTVGIKERVEVAGLVCAFMNAQQRTSKKAEYEGELDARHITKEMGKSEFLAMKQAWELKWWPLEDKETPAKCYLERRAEELESGEMRAESLQTVLNRDEDDPDVMQPVWDPTGNVRLRRGSVLISEPENPEQLRKRLELMGTALMMLATRHTNKQGLQGITPQMMHTYCAYLLGEFVWEMVAKDPEGHTVAVPNWPLVLSYERAIRKKAYKLMYDSTSTFPVCLVSACNDTTTKERFFSTPLAVAAAGNKRQGTAAAVSEHKEKTLPVIKVGKPNGVGKSAPKAKAKAKGKGKGAKGQSVDHGQCASQTPEGLNICFNYNNQAVKCKSRECRFEHVCGICFQKHPLWVCKGQAAAHPAAGGETAGGGKGSH
jgi:hypothetical protein